MLTSLPADIVRDEKLILLGVVGIFAFRNAERDFSFMTAVTKTKARLQRPTGYSKVDG